MNEGLCYNTRQIDYDQEIESFNFAELKAMIEAGYQRARQRHPELPAPMTFAQHNVAEIREAEGRRRRHAKVAVASTTSTPATAATSTTAPAPATPSTQAQGPDVTLPANQAAGEAASLQEETCA